MRNKGKQKIPKKVQKAFILTSIIGAVVKVGHNGDPRFTALIRQVDKAMRVFSIKAGPHTYNALSNITQEIWMSVDEEHDTALLVDEIPVCIEMLYHLLPYNDMKAFLSMGYATSNKVRDEVKSSLLCMILDIDAKINHAIGTKQIIDRNKLGAIMVKPVPVKKGKHKKGLSKAHKRHLAAVEEHQKRKERVRSFLQKRIEQAKAKQEESA